MCDCRFRKIFPRKSNDNISVIFPGVITRLYVMFLSLFVPFSSLSLSLSLSPHSLSCSLALSFFFVNNNFYASFPSFLFVISRCFSLISTHSLFSSSSAAKSGLGNRIHRLHLCRGSKTPLLPTRVLDMTLNNLIARLH